MRGTSLDGKSKLGVVVPADRPDQNEVGLGESGDYGTWLAARSIDGIEVAFGGSRTDGSHAPESVWATGRTEVLLPPARQLAAEGCHAIVWACTCASFIGGLAWSRAQSAELANATGLPASSTSLSLLAALEHLDAGTVDLLSPYPEPVTETLVAFLDEAKIEVAAVASLDCPDDNTSIKLDLVDEVRRFDAPLAPRRHPLLVPDTAVYSLDKVAAAEAALGRPVVTANQATVWQSLRLLGREHRLADAGTLFAARLPATLEPTAGGPAHS